MTSQFEIQPVSVTQITSVSNAGSKRPSLIDKYFDFQENMSKKCNTSDSPQENRNEYMRNYMRKRRENSLIKQKDRESNLRSMTKARQSKEFKEKELTSKKIVRENPERKQKDRESNLRSMTKARKSKEFREKELASKQKNRENFQTKQKDRESKLQSMTKARQRKRSKEKEKKQCRAVGEGTFSASSLKLLNQF
ncbi:splicing regulatory glutamine/lysine-rich protein 1-like [Saccostrea cucullata]|uniref:splicing regulatory glutamine/lysine-rich protein 1-like n=1 Tax=Saccostrea cuccullata TaxID=36930 RepID=UPI002ED5E80C